VGSLERWDSVDIEWKEADAWSCCRVMLFMTEGYVGECMIEAAFVKIPDVQKASKVHRQSLEIMRHCHPK
jgi:hypothetical protein